jgi:hypothetical protein
MTRNGKNVRPLETERRHARRLTDPPNTRCVFCIESEHVAGRNHDPLLTFPICQKHHDQLTEARRDAGLSMRYESNPGKRRNLALRSTAIFLRMLADALWRWSKDDPDDD